METDTSHPSGVNYPKTIKLLENYLINLGLTTEVVDIPVRATDGKKNRVHLVARKFFGNNLPTLLMYNHIDTVPADYQNSHKFKITNGRAYGRGTSDHKGSTVAVLSALESLKATGFKGLKFNLIFWATTDEETNQKAQLTHMTKKLKLPKNTIVFDPDTFAGGVTNAHLGVLQFEIIVKGKAVHSGMSHLGTNAVEATSKLLYFFSKIKKEYEKQLSQYPTFKSSGLSHLCSRCNVNKISGGIANNVVPDKCVVTIDCRYIPEGDVVKEREKLYQRIKKFCQNEKISYDLKDIVMIEGYASEHPKMYELDKIYRKYANEGGIFGTLGSTEMSEWTKYLSLPHFGIGTIRTDTNTHGVDEFAYLRDIENLSLTMEEFLTRS